MILVKTKVIDIETVSPFLACVADLMRMQSIDDVHIAQKHQIINAPNPGMCIVEPVPGAPPGEEAVLVKLGKPIRLDQICTPEWWPRAYSLRVRNKLNRRLNYQGRAFPLHLAVTCALLDTFYTDKRFRLKYKSSPIADFGLAFGGFRVINRDRLAFILPDGTVVRDQDPTQHWWIYFKTARGEELTLDLCTFSWNLCMLVPSEPYIKEPIQVSPMTFRNREIVAHGKGKGTLYTEKKRYSVLRDEVLGQAATTEDTDGTKIWPKDRIIAWAEDKLGKPMTEKEQHWLMSTVAFVSVRLGQAMAQGDWKKWPVTPDQVLDLDPLEELESKGRMPPPGEVLE